MEINSLLVVNVPSEVSFMDQNRDHMIIKHIHSNCHSWRIILCLVLEMSEFRCDAENLTFLSLNLSLPSLSLIHGNIISWRAHQSYHKGPSSQARPRIHQKTACSSRRMEQSIKCSSHRIERVLIEEATSERKDTVKTSRNIVSLGGHILRTFLFALVHSSKSLEWSWSARYLGSEMFFRLWPLYVCKSISECCVSLGCCQLVENIKSLQEISLINWKSCLFEQLHKVAHKLVQHHKHNGSSQRGTNNPCPSYERRIPCYAQTRPGNKSDPSLLDLLCFCRRGWRPRKGYWDLCERRLLRCRLCLWCRGYRLSCHGRASTTRNIAQRNLPIILTAILKAIPTAVFP